MTDEQINAAIHAALGNPKGCPRCDSDECAYNKGLNYCTDLNAMAEAEKVLFKKQVDKYLTILCLEVQQVPSLYNATARQRAEAFLRTLGKWEEVHG